MTLRVDRYAPRLLAPSQQAVRRTTQLSGTLTTAIARGLEIREALCFSVATASLGVTRKGAQQSIPTEYTRLFQKSLIGHMGSVVQIHHPLKTMHCFKDAKLGRPQGQLGHIRKKRFRCGMGQFDYLLSLIAA